MHISTVPESNQPKKDLQSSSTPYGLRCIAADAGIEPTVTGSEPALLPLQQSAKVRATKVYFYIQNRIPSKMPENPVFKPFFYFVYNNWHVCKICRKNKQYTNFSPCEIFRLIPLGYARKKSRQPFRLTAFRSGDIIFRELLKQR